MKEENKVKDEIGDEKVNSNFIELENNYFHVEMDELVNSYEMVQLEFFRDDWYAEKDLYGVAKLSASEN